MNPRCPAPELQSAVLDEVRNAQELPSDLAQHLDQCVACQIQVERLRRMAAVWTGDEVDEDALALAEAKFLARRETARLALGWFDVVPFASAGVAAGLLLLVATGTVALPWKSRSGTEHAKTDATEPASLPGILAPSNATRIAPVFASNDESAKRVRASAHIETTRGVAPLVNGLRVELKRGESAKVALRDGHGSTVEGPCLVEFWSTPTEVGGWRIVREETPARDERSSSEGTSAAAEHAANEDNAAHETAAIPDENAARENSAAPGETAAETPGSIRQPSAPASGASPLPAASGGHNAASDANGAGHAPANKKSGRAGREGSAAAALNETVANNTEAAPGASVNLGSVRAWARAAAALREDDFESADRAFNELTHATDPMTRDAARLARAQLWMSRGRESEVRPVLEQLAQSGATPLVRRRATELLYRDVH
jgi:hypothetical protein